MMIYQKMKGMLNNIYIYLHYQTEIRLKKSIQCYEEKYWPDVEGVEIDGDVKMTLLEKHKPIYKNITKIISMKKKQIVVQLINFFLILWSVKISSVQISLILSKNHRDCIQNSRDDIQLNKCLRFNTKLKNEESHFPG